MKFDEEIDDEVARKAEDIWDTVGEKFKDKEVSSTEFKMILIDEMDVNIDDIDKKTIIALFNIVDKVFDTLNKYDGDSENRLMYG